MKSKLTLSQVQALKAASKNGSYYKLANSLGLSNTEAAKFLAVC
jgi:hypothetical protein